MSNENKTISKKIGMARYIFKIYLLKYAIRLVLNLHSLTYKIAASLSIRMEGVHPKHRLLNYKEWFIDRLSSDDIVLDVGSNTGSMPRLFAKKVLHVYAMEIDANLVAKALSYDHPANIDFIHADATIFDYSKLQPTSVITLSNVLEHIDDRARFLNSLVNRVNWQSDKERRILIRVPMVDRDWITLYKREQGVEWRLDPTHFTEYTRVQFEDELNSADIRCRGLDVRFGEIYAECIVQEAR